MHAFPPSDASSRDASGAAAAVHPGERPPDACLPPLVRCREEHSISRRDIDPDALKVLYRLSKSGYTAYLVGGGVRDLLLGRKPKDFDISTNARPEEIRALFRNCILIGRRFRLAHIRYADKIIETSTFRSAPSHHADPADPEADLFQRDDNSFGNPQEDALRRDFTVNGLFYDIDTFSVIDYVGGTEDLAKRRIRSIGDPNIRFREDPIRMVRAVRFASRLDFDFDAETLDAIRRHREEVAKASPARLLEEIARLFAFSAGEKAVGILHVTGLLQNILPEIAECLDGPDADAGLFWSRLRALDAGDTVLPDATPAVIFSVLLADALAARMRRDWKGGSPPRPRFDKIRAFIDPIGQRLRFPRKLVDRVIHMYMAQHRFDSPGGKRNSLAGFVTQDWFHEALALAEINRTAGGQPQAELNPWREMLVERMYGRDDAPAADRDRGRETPRRESRNNPPRPAAATDEAAADEASPDKKMSRSARRRRNKRRNRLLREEEARITSLGGAACPEIDGMDGMEDENELLMVSAGASGPVAETASEEPAAAPPPERRPRTKAASDGNDGVDDAAGTGKSRKGSRRDRSRRNRGGGRRGTETTADAGTADAAAARNAEPHPAEPQPQPLTAAAFYTPREPEDKSRAGKGRKGRETRAKDAGNKAKTAGEAPDSPSRKPPALDRSEEADIPMHWLDEI